MLNWNPELIKQAKNFQKRLDEEDYSAIQQEVLKLSSQHIADVTGGIYKYFSKSSIKNNNPPNNLQKYKAEDKSKKPILLIPSLINRASIFDLSPDYSFYDFLESKGYQPIILDWGDPNESQKNHNVADYITERLLPEIKRINLEYVRKPVLVGYCMGGMMAMAASQIIPDEIESLALLATPWDFRSMELNLVSKDGSNILWMKSFIKNTPIIPAHIIHSWLYLRDPWLVHERFAAYSKMESGSEEEKLFEIRQDWLQDGVALTSAVAEDCFISWALENQTIEGGWEVMGEVIDPAKIRHKIFIAMAENDNVVPPVCINPIVEKQKKAHIVISPSGHLGLIAGRSAKDYLWNNIANWLYEL